MAKPNFATKVTGHMGWQIDLFSTVTKKVNGLLFLSNENIFQKRKMRPEAVLIPSKPHILHSCICDEQGRR
jgi:hypothetical protein